MRHPSPLEVWKFGGASLADAQAVERAARLIAAHRGPLVVVASAVGGITDLLLDGARAATVDKRDEAARAAATFLRRHREVVHGITPPGRLRRTLLAAIDAAAREYRELSAAVGVLGHV